jgi:hypothetical protein
MVISIVNQVSLRDGNTAGLSSGCNPESEWPSSACLDPTEIEEYVAHGFLAEGRQSHLESCEFCQLVTDFDAQRANPIQICADSTGA